MLPVHTHFPFPHVCSLVLNLLVRLVRCTFALAEVVSYNEMSKSSPSQQTNSFMFQQNQLSHPFISHVRVHRQEAGDGGAHSHVGSGQGTQPASHA